MTRATDTKSLRLMRLEDWAKTYLLSKMKLESSEFNERLQEHCLIMWAVTDGMAKNMARIVQLRLIATGASKEVLAQRPSTDEVSAEAEMSIAEILQGYHAKQPPIQPTDFPIIEEKDDA